MSYDTIETERDGAILRVWLNRPERLNAINARMLREVGDLFASLETDFETRLVVLGGRGRSFCAGADRKAPKPGETRVEPRSDRERRWLSQLGRRACRAIQECEVLTIARVHGHAIGGGCCFALSCDFRVAARDAVFRIPEVELGIPLAWAGAPRLLQEIGAARTRELVLLCEDVLATHAAEWGMVHRAVDPGDLDAAVARMARSLLAKPEMAVSMTKTQLRAYARLAALGDVSETDAEMIEVAIRSESARGRFALPSDSQES